MSLRKIIEFSIGPIGTAAISLVSVPVIAWFFSPADVGRLAMLQVGVNFCLLLFSLGLDQAYVREYHESPQRSSLFKACIQPGLLLLSLTLLTFIWFSGTLSRWLFEIADARLDLLAALCILGSFVGRFFSLILRMQGRGLAFSLSQLLPKLVFLGVVCLWVSTANKHNLFQLLVGSGLAQAFVAILFAWNTRTEWYTPSAPLPPARRRQLLQFGLPLIFSGLAFWAMTSLDRLFLRHFSSFEQLGIYSVANSFAGVAIVLQNIFATMWAPMAYRWHAEGVQPKAIHGISEQLLAVVMLIFALGGLLSWLLGYLLPPQYYQAQFIVLGCLVYPLLYTLGETTSVGLGITRKSGFMLLASLCAVCVNLMLNYALVPRFGAAGAASATAVSFLVLFITRTEMSSRLWASMPRFQTYAMVALGTALTVGYSLFGAKYTTLFLALWVGLLIANLVIFQKQYREIINWLQSIGRSATKGPSL